MGSGKSGVFAIVFAVGYAIFYAAAEQFNLALFTYHPAIGEFDLGPQRSRNGPPMYWYGWMATAALGAGALGGIATMLPVDAARPIAPALSWIVPLIAMVAMGYFMAPFFLR